MSRLFMILADWYQLIIHDLADPRNRGTLIVENPFYGIFIIFSYIYFVTKWGPRMMKNRKPFQLKNILILYNIFQIVCNAYLFSQGFLYAYGPWGVYKFSCQPVDWSNSRFGLMAAKSFRLFYALKLIDLIDTVFMVLRKKNTHISFLHVYHHAGMSALAWAAAKYFPGGHSSFVGFFNSFVHMIMYSYYLLTSIWPPQQRNRLWWKKYLTLLQIGQFIVIGIHQTLPLFLPWCSYTRLAAFFLTPQAVFMTILFGDFYVKAYIKTRAEKNFAGKKANGHCNGRTYLNENNEK